MHLCCMTEGREDRIKMEFQIVTCVGKTSICESQILNLFCCFINFSLTTLNSVQFMLFMPLYVHKPYCNWEIMVNNLKQTVDKWVLAAAGYFVYCFQHHKASNQFVFNVILNRSHGNTYTHMHTNTPKIFNGLYIYTGSRPDNRYWKTLDYLKHIISLFSY